MTVDSNLRSLSLDINQSTTWPIHSYGLDLFMFMLKLMCFNINLWFLSVHFNVYVKTYFFFNYFINFCSFKLLILVDMLYFLSSTVHPP